MIEMWCCFALNDEMWNMLLRDCLDLMIFFFFWALQSKRLPCKYMKSSNLRHPVVCHNSWIQEMQQASDKSIIISEVLDSRTRNLVSVSRISDYVLSNELVSMALAMVAEDKQINRVLEELFAEKVLWAFIRLLFLRCGYFEITILHFACIEY